MSPYSNRAKFSDIMTIVKGQKVLTRESLSTIIRNVGSIHHIKKSAKEG